MRSRLMAIGIGICFFAALAGAQQPAFEVASVRAVADARSFKAAVHVNSASVEFSNVTLETILMRVYRVQDYQVSGPAWIRTARFAITAKAARPGSEDEMFQMMQSLLADRFQMVLHHEARPISVYALVVAGKKVKMGQGDAKGLVFVGPDSPDQASHEITYRNVSMPGLAIRLRRFVGRPVIDETGLTGVYNFKLPLTIPPLGGPTVEETASVFTNLPDRLGLKLESKKSPIDVLVIDRLERPSGN